MTCDVVPTQVCENKSVPRKVDHEERREDIARAVWNLIAQGGISAATVRAVAAASGWSMGAVRHYFNTQAELLQFAAQEMMRRIPQRISAVLAAGPPSPARAQALLEELLPLDERREAECTVWLSYLVEARTDAAYEDLRGAAWDGERYLCRLALSDLLGIPMPQTLHTPLGENAERHVNQLHVLLDGLTMMGTLLPSSADHGWLRARLRGHLSALLQQ
jgi:AcrR family transcriptional regulator